MEIETVIGFLDEYKLKFLTFHVLGTALGLGGATISDILFFKFLKDFRISQKEEEVLHVLKSVVLGALVLIIATGVALYLPAMQELNRSAPFLVKTIGVGVLTINGIALHLYVAPHLLHLNLKEHEKMGRHWHRVSFALGSISIVSWYSVFAIAMLKEMLFSWSFTTLLCAYLLLLIIGITGSQLVEMRMTRKAH